MDQKTAKQPVTKVRIGALQAAIWENKSEKYTTFNVTFSRLYRANGQWHSTTSFGRDDLLALAKLADQAHTAITAGDFLVSEPDAER